MVDARVAFGEGMEVRPTCHRSDLPRKWKAGVRDNQTGQWPIPIQIIIE